MDMLQQLPQLRQSNPDYKTYANKTYETLFSENQRRDAIVYQTTYLESSVLYNTDGVFSLEPLPVEAQVSPVFGVVARDFDGDGWVDLWLGGNFYGLKPEVGYNNASRGVYLSGSESGFSYLPPHLSGIDVPGEVRDVITVIQKDKLKLLIARNNRDLVVFERH